LLWLAYGWDAKKGAHMMIGRNDMNLLKNSIGRLRRKKGFPKGRKNISKWNRKDYNMKK